MRPAPVRPVAVRPAADGRRRAGRGPRRPGLRSPGCGGWAARAIARATGPIGRREPSASWPPPKNWPFHPSQLAFRVAVMSVADHANRRLARRTTQRVAGLILCGVGMALMIRSRRGLTSCDVFHEGLSQVSGLGFGRVVVLLGIPILLLWIPLRQRPGFGTVANLVVIGIVVDGALVVIPDAPLWVRAAYLISGILVIGMGTGLYIGARMGPGPRDGLMTGIVARFPRLSIRLVRTV